MSQPPLTGTGGARRLLFASLLSAVKDGVFSASAALLAAALVCIIVIEDFSLWNRTSSWVLGLLMGSELRRLLCLDEAEQITQESNVEEVEYSPVRPKWESLREVRERWGMMRQQRLERKVRDS